MLISYNWLQSFFAEKIPVPESIKTALENHIFEVEKTNNLANGDTILEIDVLPNRAGDCLSHLGVAREISAILNLDFKTKNSNEVLVDGGVNSAQVKVENNLCRRYMGRRVENVKVAPSPSWLVEKINSMGSKSINNLVDLTNFILFDIGQPMHIFDADKVSGAISVRLAKDGESMTTLDGKVLELSHEDLIIADEKNVLALAGVKGGKIAEVDNGTTNIIIESANFDPKMVRRSAARHGIRTDAVKRFENNLAPMFAELGMNSISLHILDLLPEAKFGPITDEYESPQVEKTINIDINYIQNRLGLKITDTDILDIFKRLLFKPQQTGSNIVVVVPLYRLDIDEPDTLVEEVGRLYGYDKIPSVLPNKNSYDNDSKNFLAAQKLREVLFGLGFSEIYGYTFSATGSVELANPLASDRPFLRTNLSNSIKEKIALNLKSVLFDTDTVAIFDIGTVFDDEKENINVAIGIGNTKSKFHTNNKTIDLVISKIKEVFLVDVSPFVIKGELETIIEFPLNLLSEVSNEVEINLHDFIKDSVAYEPVSLYPRIIRDIALFVPKDTIVDIVMETIKNKAGSWLTIGPVLFDEFTKEGDVKTSLAFRLVFQAKDKTLEDKEINQVMEEVSAELKNRGWEVR